MDAVPELPPRSIKADARKCQSTLTSLLYRLAKLENVPLALATAVQDEYGRFNIWAATMAVFAPDQACLDFRLKDVPEASQLFVKQIGILTTRLEQLHERVDKQVVDAAHEGPDAPPSSESWTDENIIHSIRQTIDWLHRLSNIVRKAGFASQNEKAAAFVIRDDSGEEGTDITESLRCCFQALIRRDCKDINDALVDRLAQTMILRRKRILYRRKRQRRWAVPQVDVTRTKLDVLLPVPPALEIQNADIPQTAEEAAADDEASPKHQHLRALSTLTVSVLEPESYRQQGARSQISRATTAPFQPSEKRLVPPHPRAAEYGTVFVCDYCCLILSSEVALNREKWGNHVKKDLDAYICVFDDCTDPYQLYSSSEEWLAHMSSQHRTRWYCTARDHEPISFETRQQFMDHMEGVHPGRFRREQLGFVADSCARALSPTIPNCPFCSETAGNLEAHVRQHLHYFALQSLPWPEDSTQSTDHTSTDASDDTSEELDRATLHDAFDDVPSPEPMQDIEHDPPYHPPPPPPPQGPILGHPPSSKTLDRTPTYITNASQPDTAADHASERRQRLLNSLEFSQIDVRRTNIRTPYTKTCRWLLLHSKYQDWLDPGMQAQNHGFLWMRGKPGTGKSTMMKFVYLETKKAKKPSMAVASFFFNARGDYLERSISGMYRSLLLQLLCEFSDLQSVLDDTDILPQNQQDCPDLNALKELLDSAVTALGQRSFTCFVDALDECDDLEVRDMVQFFEKLAENATDQSIQFRICFSSRQYPHIDIRRGIVLTLEEESGHGEDLAHYVESRFRITSPSLRKELQSQILDKAAGVFIWVVLVVEILNNESSHGARALRKKLSEIPPILSELSMSMLARDQQRPESLQLCILWILFAKRPLSPAEFRNALWAGLLERGLADAELPDDMHADAALVASSSKGLAEITKSKQPTVQFIHKLVRDFFVEGKVIRDLWPGLGFEWEGRSHEILKRCCTSYLYHPRIQAILVAAEGGDNERNAMAEQCSFLEYASQQVLYHANAAAPVVPQDGFLTQFFASAGIRVINRFEKFKARQYGSDATPLYVLADKGLGNLIRIQRKQESPAYVPGERYEHPFFAALANGHKDAVAALLGLSSATYGGVDITEVLNHRKDFRGYQGRTPLSWAAQEGKLRIVELLIQGGADLNEIDSSGQTPLHQASKNGHETVARLLINHGADVNAQNKDGSTALLLALENGHDAVVWLLIDNRADVNAQNKDGSTALLWASENGHEEVVRLLIDHGADVNAQNKDGSTALIRASENGHEAVARRLLDSGADVNVKAQNKFGSTV